MSSDAWSPAAGLTMAAVDALLGWFVPALIARIPEPSPEPSAEPAAGPAAGPAAEPVPDPTLGPGRPADEAGRPPEERGTTSGPGAPGDPETTTGPTQETSEEPKEPYPTIAALPGLAWRSAVASAAVAGLVGLRIGWDPVLLVWAYLVPVGIALAVVDWRTRLLPTKVIAPSYGILVALTLLAASLTGDWDSLLRAGWGWLVAGGTFFALWFVYPRGMGYGDVRLAGLLGIALGYLGWAELLTGVYAGFLLGGFGGLLLSVLRIVDRKAYPFGPFMLGGAVVGVLAGPGVAAWYA
jgi:leader peptidase (prepilin peptidase)/N-methyltransferase